jgi:hypothetical protein
MDAEAHGQLDTPVALQAGIEALHRCQNLQSGIHGTPGVVFMGLRIAEVDQEAVPEVLGNMAIKAVDHLITGCLIGAHHVSEVFGVELAGQDGRVYDIAKQDRELATFRVRSIPGRWRRDNVMTEMVCLGERL